MSEIFFAWAQSKVDNISTYRDQTYTSKYTGTFRRNQTYNSNHTGTGSKSIILSIGTGTNRDYNRDQIYTSKYTGACRDKANTSKYTGTFRKQTYNS